MPAESTRISVLSWWKLPCRDALSALRDSSCKLDGSVKPLIAAGRRAAARSAGSSRKQLKREVVSSGWRADGKWRRLCRACRCWGEVCVVNQVWTWRWHLNHAHPAAANETAAKLQNKSDTLTTNCETKVQHDDSPDCESVPHTFPELKHENQSWIQSRGSSKHSPSCLNYSYFHQSDFRSDQSLRYSLWMDFSVLLLFTLTFPSLCASSSSTSTFSVEGNHLSSVQYLVNSEAAFPPKLFGSVCSGCESFSTTVWIKQKDWCGLVWSSIHPQFGALFSVLALISYGAFNHIS